MSSNNGGVNNLAANLAKFKKIAEQPNAQQMAQNINTQQGSQYNVDQSVFNGMNPSNPAVNDRMAFNQGLNNIGIQDQETIDAYWTVLDYNQNDHFDDEEFETYKAALMYFEGVENESELSGNTNGDETYDVTEFRFSDLRSAIAEAPQYINEDDFRAYVGDEAYEAMVAPYNGDFNAMLDAISNGATIEEAGKINEPDASALIWTEEPTPDNTTEEPQEPGVQLQPQGSVDSERQERIDAMTTAMGDDGKTDRAGVKDVLGEDFDASGAYATRGTLAAAAEINGADSEYMKQFEGVNNSTGLLGLNPTPKDENNQPQVGDVVITQNADGTNTHSGVVSEVITNEDGSVQYKVIEFNSDNSDGNGAAITTYPTTNNGQAKDIIGFFPNEEAREAARVEENQELTQSFFENETLDVNGAELNSNEYNFEYSEDYSQVEINHNNGSSISIPLEELNAMPTATREGGLSVLQQAPQSTVTFDSANNEWVAKASDGTETRYQASGNLKPTMQFVDPSEAGEHSGPEATEANEGVPAYTDPWSDIQSLPENENTTVNIDGQEYNAYRTADGVIIEKEATDPREHDSTLTLSNEALANEETRNSAMEVLNNSPIGAKVTVEEDGTIVSEREDGVQFIYENNDSSNPALVALPSGYEITPELAQEIGNATVTKADDTNGEQYSVTTDGTSVTETLVQDNDGLTKAGILQTHPEYEPAMSQFSDDVRFEEKDGKTYAQDGDERKLILSPSNIALIEDADGMTLKGLQDAGYDISAYTHGARDQRFEIVDDQPVLTKDENGYTMAGLQNLDSELRANDIYGLNFLENASVLWDDDTRFNPDEATKSINITSGGKEYNLVFDTNISQYVLTNTENNSTLNFGQFVQARDMNDDFREVGLELLNNSPDGTEIVFNETENAWVITNGNTTSYYSTSADNADKTSEVKNFDPTNTSFINSVYGQIDPSGGEFIKITEGGKEYIQHNGMTYEITEDDAENEIILSITDDSTGETQYTKAGILQTHPEYEPAMSQFSDDVRFEEKDGKTYAQDGDERKLILSPSNIALIEDADGMTLKGLQDAGYDISAYTHGARDQRFEIVDDQPVLTKDENGYTMAGLQNLDSELRANDIYGLNFLENASVLWDDDTRFNPDEATKSINITSGGKEYNLVFDTNISQYVLTNTENNSTLNFGQFVQARDMNDDFREVGLELLNNSPDGTEIVFNETENAWVITNGNTTSYYSTSADNADKSVTTYTTVDEARTNRNINDFLDLLYPSGGDLTYVDTQDIDTITHGDYTYEIEEQDSYSASITSITHETTGNTVTIEEGATALPTKRMINDFPDGHFTQLTDGWRVEMPDGRIIKLDERGNQIGNEALAE